MAGFYHKVRGGGTEFTEEVVEWKRGRFDLSYLWDKDNHTHLKIAPIFV